jgi:hypothetical protein
MEPCAIVSSLEVLRKMVLLYAAASAHCHSAAGKHRSNWPSSSSCIEDKNATEETGQKEDIHLQTRAVGVVVENGNSRPQVFAPSGHRESDTLADLARRPTLRP